MAKVFTPRFCPSCGGAVVRPMPSRGGPPLVCATCGLGIYQDPKVAVAAVVRDPQGRFILLRRAQRDQAHGLWILPGGHVDRGEELHAAALREVAEETGLEVALEGLLGVYSYPGNPVVLIVYAAQAGNGPPRPGPEALEIKAFPPDQLPWGELGYLSTGEALRHALASGTAKVAVHP